MNDKELRHWRIIPCILKVDLEYPEELRDLHNDYPVAHENVKPPGCAVEKVIPNLGNKQKYVIHHETLKLYESLGLKVIKVHKEISFYESVWLKKYVELNTELRTEAKTILKKISSNL